MIKLCPVLDGDNIRIRLATIQDARFLFALRSDPYLTKFIPPVTNFDNHCAWLEKNLSRVDDYLFIAEDKNSGESKGIISIHDISFERMEGYIGRWIMERNSRYGFEALHLAYLFAFENLKLRRILTETLIENPVMQFHLAVGLKKTMILPEKWRIDDKEYLVQQMAVCREDWPEVEKNIIKFKKVFSR